MTIPDLREIRTESVTEAVYQLLREQIILRKFQPGQRISADGLAGRLGVSRTPVHEALVLLESEGLVEIVPRRGTFVSDLTPTSLVEAMNVRRALELLACESAATRVEGDDIARLKGLMEEMESAARSAPNLEEASRDHEQMNLAFHQRIVQLSGNRRLVEIYRGLDAHIKIARAHVRVSSWRDRLLKERTEHEAIVAALEARDTDALRNAMDAHLRRSTESLLADLIDNAE